MQQWREKNPKRQRELKRRWDEQNLERKRENERHWYEKNSEKRRENVRQWRKKNPDYSRRWRDQNPEYARWWRENNDEHHRENNRRWRKLNPDKERAKNSRRRSSKKQAVPPWANHDAIKEIYAEAVRLERKTGIKYHVDHIYPLQSDYMCGLHIETNLQILTEKQNKKKSNRTWPGQLECQRLPLHLNGFEKSSNWGRPS